MSDASNAAPSESASATSPLTIGLLLFDGAEELDFVGPWEVFTATAQLRQEAKLDAPRVVTVAATQDPVRCAKGLRVLPDHDFENAPDLDILLVPGGIGTRTVSQDPLYLDWIAKTSARCQWTTSVCTGSLVLVHAGPARGKRVTTWWGLVETLRGVDGVGQVLDNVRYVRDGQLVTSAGVSAGIDMALWLVGQLYDPATARRTQRYIEYDPAPPYTAEV